MMTLMKKIIRKVLSLKLLIMLEYHNIKYFCNGYVPNSSEEAFVIKKVKNTVLWALLLVTLKTKRILDRKSN